MVVYVLVYLIKFLKIVTCLLFTTFRLTAAGAIDWACIMCTGSNLDSNSFCTLCGSPRQGASNSGRRNAGGSEWACVMCTTSNASGNSICQMCSTLRPQTLSTHDSDWVCTRCTLVNDMNNKLCSTCGSPRSNAVGKNRRSQQRANPNNDKTLTRGSRNSGRAPHAINGGSTEGTYSTRQIFITIAEKAKLSLCSIIGNNNFNRAFAATTKPMVLYKLC